MCTDAPARHEREGERLQAHARLRRRLVADRLPRRGDRPWHGRQDLQPVLAADTVIEDEHPAKAADAGNDRVALQMPGLVGRSGLRGQLREFPSALDGLGRVRRVLLSPVPSPVDQIVVRQADGAGSRRRGACLRLC